MEKTSKDYYESVMRDFELYARGRSLEQYCRDESVDYKWLTKAQEQYGVPAKGCSKKQSRRGKRKTLDDMILLHYDPEEEFSNEEVPHPCQPPQEKTEESSISELGEWRVVSLKVKTPAGDEIEISASKPSAVSELLAKLTPDHA